MLSRRVCAPLQDDSWPGLSRAGSVQSNSATGAPLLTPFKRVIEPSQAFGPGMVGCFLCVVRRATSKNASA